MHRAQFKFTQQWIRHPSTDATGGKNVENSVHNWLENGRSAMGRNCWRIWLEKPQQQLFASCNPDAWRNSNRRWLHHRRKDPGTLSAARATVVIKLKAEAARKIRRSTQQAFAGEVSPTARYHLLDAHKRFSCAQQDRSPNALPVGDDIDAAVYAVDLIDVQAPTRSEHRTVACRHP